MSTLQGTASVKVSVEDTGQINIEIKTTDEDEKKINLAFKSDSDIKGLVEMLRWARVSSLKAQGYKVVM
tara:strand:- start:129 stop:335 length:207 start_codon:yes stop_codon:yes gene_type:complete